MAAGVVRQRKRESGLWFKVLHLVCDGRAQRHDDCLQRRTWSIVAFHRIHDRYQHCFGNASYNEMLVVNGLVSGFQSSRPQERPGELVAHSVLSAELDHVRSGRCVRRRDCEVPQEQRYLRADHFCIFGSNELRSARLRASFPRTQQVSSLFC